MIQRLKTNHSRSGSGTVAGVLAAMLLGSAAMAQPQAGSPAFQAFPKGLSSTNQSGTTSGTINTFTTALASSTTRKGCLFANNSNNVEYIYYGTGTATVAAATVLNPGAVFTCGNGSTVEQSAIQIASNVASSTYAGWSQ